MGHGANELGARLVFLLQSLEAHGVLDGGGALAGDRQQKLR